MSSKKNLKNKVRKIHDNEVYMFKNGLATVPGCWGRYHQPITITLTEFEELISKGEEQ